MGLTHYVATKLVYHLVTSKKNQHYLCPKLGKLFTMCYLCSDMRRHCIILFLLLLPYHLWAQHHFKVASWNVENLFDCMDDSTKQDDEFLPNSEREWTHGRYWRKIEDISRVIMGIGEETPPALVALQEVENDSVMAALTQRGSLRALGYHYVMTDSPDQRGIDVALIYQPAMFRLYGYECVSVPSVEHGLRPTRDLLHAWGRVPGGDTLHVVVCHLPSRAGRGSKAKRNRRLASQTLYALTDSLLRMTPRCHLIVMGDFNASPHDVIFRKQLDKLPLTSLIPQKRRPTEGTYRFRGNWSWLDHMLVSETMLQHCAYEDKQVRRFTQPWLQRTMSDGTWYPRRTFLGPNYQGGVSDHIPIYCDFTY